MLRIELIKATNQKVKFDEHQVPRGFKDSTSSGACYYQMLVRDSKSRAYIIPPRLYAGKTLTSDFHAWVGPTNLIDSVLRIAPPALSEYLMNELISSNYEYEVDGIIYKAEVL